MPIQFNEWISSRGISGEYGYVNTKTGQFRTTLPNSKEEKTQNVEKSKKAALVTHSARQAKFNRTQAKRRNHSDETVKKINNIPIINVNKDGTFTNNYVRQMAPSESSTKVIYPEFDLITLGQTIKPLVNFGRKSLDIASRQKSYTGVPNRRDTYNNYEKMSERFLDKYNGDIWTTDNLNAARQYSIYKGQEGKVFTIFGKTKRLAKHPKLPEGVETIWTGLPYQFKDKKLIINPNAKIINSKDYNISFIDKNGNLSNRTILGTEDLINNWKDKIVVIPTKNSTGSLFEISKRKGYDGIQFENILDEGFKDSRGKYVDLPFNEYNYKAGADVIKAPLGTTKLDLIKKEFNNIDYVPTIQGIGTLITKNKLNESK